MAPNRQGSKCSKTLPHNCPKEQQYIAHPFRVFTLGKSPKLLWALPDLGMAVLTELHFIWALIS
jgi:hypothetical protein